MVDTLDTIPYVLYHKFLFTITEVALQCNQHSLICPTDTL